MALDREAELPLGVPLEAAGSGIGVRAVDTWRRLSASAAGGAVPRVRRADGLRGRKVRPAFAEAFRLLALTLQRLAADRPLRSVLVMGAYPGDGRTTTVVNLGITLAEMGCRAVLVEADGRRPSLARQFKTTLPANQTADRSSPPPVGAVPTDLRGLAVVPQPPLDGTQVDVTAMASLLSSLRPSADFILVDSPPCLRYADAFLLAPHVDGVVYVVRRRQQDVAAQQTIRAQLARLGANVLGVVFNEE